MGGTVPLGIGEGVVWVALCHWDWWGQRRVGSGVPLGVHGVAVLGCSVASA